MTPVLSALIAATVALGGWVAGWLTAGAAVAATAIGMSVLTGAGLPGLALLGTFFISGSLLSRRGTPGARRTIAQVAANGWAAGVGGLVIPFAPSLGWAVLAGGLAAAQADTWATELGRHSRHSPRLVTTGRTVPVGTSGGVTTLGTVAAGAGAVTLALVAWALNANTSMVWMPIAGVGGMLVDSLLGASLQVRFVCPACGAAVESRRHCATPTTPVRGLRWMTNDTVNVFGTGAGAAIAALAAAR
ncbi:MAG: DUF92 domain-containing protein [Gemmatimonadota bacterium]|nr:DUF92 domain-containing protein [Gemmatimonadota bacterium]MDH4350104.1 DUF92 domain-containing protein [Gemmatimonadota bacterium]MDH5195846.1 DUF92 domain-containing protein [Gemmatimonadota bacterium]